MDAPEQGEDEDQLGEDDGRALKRDGGACRIAEVVEAHDLGIDDVGERREDALPVGKEGRVVERPLARRLRAGQARGSACGRAARHI